MALLTLDTPAFPLLALDPPANAIPDPRLDSITIEHLLVHSAAGGTAPQRTTRNTCRGP